MTGELSARRGVACEAAGPPAADRALIAICSLLISGGCEGVRQPCDSADVASADARSSTMQAVQPQVPAVPQQQVPAPVGQVPSQPVPAPQAGVPGQTAAQPGATTFVRLRGLPFAATEQEVAAWFASAPGAPIQIARVLFTYNTTGRKSGEAVRLRALENLSMSCTRSSAFLNSGRSSGASVKS